MKKQVAPEETSREEAFRLWMSSAMPMVTLTKTVDVTALVRYGRRRGLKFNMLMCWCIGRAAEIVKEFYILPEEGNLYRYDSLSVNVIVPNSKGGINSCDVPKKAKMEEFNEQYLLLTHQVARQNKSAFLPQTMVIGTSAMVQTELDCIVNQYTEKFANPMVMWGKIRKRWFRYSLPVSFQFHHVQMDGMQAATFLENLQREICQIGRNKKNKQ